VDSDEINKVRTEHTWFSGIIIAVILITGGAELNPGPQMEKQLITFMVEHTEEMKGICKWLEMNKLSLDTMSIKLDQMNDTMKILMDEQDRIKGQVNSKTKLKKMEEEHNFKDSDEEIIY
jgi:hypothetical protein